MQGCAHLAIERLGVDLRIHGDGPVVAWLRTLGVDPGRTKPFDRGLEGALELLPVGVGRNTSLSQISDPPLTAATQNVQRGAAQATPGRLTRIAARASLRMT